MPFKKCTMCAHTWEDRDEFISCPFIKLIGYQAFFDNPDKGLYLFNHIDPKCGSTISVEVANFKDLYDGPVYTEQKTGSEECQKLCLDIHNLRLCTAHCSLSFIRDIMHIIAIKQGVLKTVKT